MTLSNLQRVNGGTQGRSNAGVRRIEIIEQHVFVERNGLTHLAEPRSAVDLWLGEFRVAAGAVRDRIARSPVVRLFLPARGAYSPAFVLILHCGNHSDLACQKGIVA